jgi:tetratricopeptide (TPR) repeat protein
VIRLYPNRAFAYEVRGDARRKQGDLEGAIADFTKIIRINPNDAKTYHRRGNARRDQGNLEGAIADYKEGLRVNPNHTVMRCETASAQAEAFSALAFTNQIGLL